MIYHIDVSEPQGDGYGSAFLGSGWYTLLLSQDPDLTKTPDPNPQPC